MKCQKTDQPNKSMEVNSNAVDSKDELDNWIHIPEFGVQPKAVNFVGFRTPIITPLSNHQYEARCIIRSQVKTARFLISRLGWCQDKVYAEASAVNKLWTDAYLQSTKSVTQSKIVSTYYVLIMMALENAEKSLSKGINGDLASFHASMAMAVRANHSLTSLSFDHIDGKVHQNKQELAELKLGFELELERKRKSLSLGGKNRAAAMHVLDTELKSWAINQFDQRTIKMKAKPFAKLLALRIPDHLKNIREDPEIMIYRAILKHQKSAAS